VTIMAKRNQQTFAKRERQHKKTEKAAQKRARRAAARDPQPESNGITQQRSADHEGEGGDASARSAQ